MNLATAEDLDRATAIMKQILAGPRYSRHEAVNNDQELHGMVLRFLFFVDVNKPLETEGNAKYAGVLIEEPYTDEKIEAACKEGIEQIKYLFGDDNGHH